jgi:Family of unknown function (DUF6114)
MLVSEQAPLPVVTHIGVQGMAGYLIPTFLALCGALLWLNPIDRLFYSLVAIFLALGSWITSNLGGFFLGMLVGVVGGALAFAWTTDAESASPGWLDERWIALPTRRLVLMFRQTAQALPQLDRGARLPGSVRLALPSAADKALGYLGDDAQPAAGQELSSDQAASHGTAGHAAAGHGTAGHATAADDG